MGSCLFGGVFWFGGSGGVGEVFLFVLVFFLVCVFLSVSKKAFSKRGFCNCILQWSAITVATATASAGLVSWDLGNKY